MNDKLNEIRDATAYPTNIQWKYTVTWILKKETCCGCGLGPDLNQIRVKGRSFVRKIKKDSEGTKRKGS